MKQAKKGTIAHRAQRRLANVSRYDIAIKDCKTDPKMEKAKEIGSRKPYYIYEKGENNEEKL